MDAQQCYTVRIHMPRVTVILTDAQYWDVRRKAGLIPLSAWFRDKGLEGVPNLIEEFPELIPQGEELAAGEASARSNDTPAARRLPKAAKPQKSIPAELPKNWGVGKEANADQVVRQVEKYCAPVDMKKFLP